MRKYKFYGSDGNGGFLESTTRVEHGSMVEALQNEILYIVHSCLKIEAV